MLAPIDILFIRFLLYFSILDDLSLKAMFKAFDRQRRGAISAEGFSAACRTYGLGLKDEEIALVYACCDYFDAGCISELEVVFLESDSAVRSQELSRFNKKTEVRQGIAFADFYNE